MEYESFSVKIRLAFEQNGFSDLIDDSKIGKLFDFSCLLIETNKSKHFTNKTVLDKSISKVLNQRYLHKSIVEEIENDN